jgi:hypothetical protein
MWIYIHTYTGRTKNNGAVLIVNTIKTAPFFCVCPVYIHTFTGYHITVSCQVHYQYDSRVYLRVIHLTSFGLQYTDVTWDDCGKLTVLCLTIHLELLTNYCLCSDSACISIVPVAT